MGEDTELEEDYTFQLRETYPGNGNLDLRLFIELARQENPQMPMIIEYLNSEEEYYKSLDYMLRIS